MGRTLWGRREGAEGGPGRSDRSGTGDPLTGVVAGVQQGAAIDAGLMRAVQASAFRVFAAEWPEEKRAFRNPAVWDFIGKALSMREYTGTESVSDIREGVQVTKSMADLFVEDAEDRIGHFPRALFPPLVTDVGMCADLNLKVSVAGDPRPQDFNLLHGYGYRRCGGTS